MADVPITTPSLFLLFESNLPLTQVHILLGHASLLHAFFPQALTRCRSPCKLSLCLPWERRGELDSALESSRRTSTETTPGWSSDFSSSISVLISSRAWDAGNNGGIYNPASVLTVPGGPSKIRSDLYWFSTIDVPIGVKVPSISTPLAIPHVGRSLWIESCWVKAQTLSQASSKRVFMNISRNITSCAQWQFCAVQFLSIKWRQILRDAIERLSWSRAAAFIAGRFRKLCFESLSDWAIALSKVAKLCFSTTLGWILERVVSWKGETWVNVPSRQTCPAVV